MQAASTATETVHIDPQSAQATTGISESTNTLQTNKKATADTQFKIIIKGERAFSKFFAQNGYAYILLYNLICRKYHGLPPLHSPVVQLTVNQ